MSWARLAGWLTILLSVGVLAAAFVAADATGTTINDPLIGAATALMGIAGGVILIKKPGNRIGIVMAVAGIAGALAGLGAGLGAGDSVSDLESGNTFLDAGPLRLVGIALGNAGFFVFMVATLGLLPLLFPTGDIPSPRWKWPARILVTLTALIALSGLFTHRLCELDPGGGESCVRNPIGIAGVGFMEFLAVAAFPLVVASLVSAVLRFRRSSGVEQRQMKWLTLSLGTVIVLLAAEAVLVEGLGLDLSPLLGTDFDLLGIAMVMVPISIAVAVLRHRLFDIDRLVSRTVSYAAVFALVAAVYGAIALGPTLVLGSADAPPWLVALATLAAAAVFNPLRRRIQAVVDRRFNRARYDAERAVEGFGDRLQDATDPDVIAEEWATAVDELLEPATVGFWAAEP
jgi:hypothetical protein